MAEGVRTRRDVKFEVEIASKLGLHLCEKCCKENVDQIKRLASSTKLEETTEMILSDIHDLTTEVKKITSERTEREDKLNGQLTEWKNKLEKMSAEFLELKQKFDSFVNSNTEKEIKWSNGFDQLSTKVESLKVPDITDKELTKRWSDLFRENVAEIKDDMKTVQRTVTDAKQSMDITADRSSRRNNLVIYNLPEDEKEAKNKDKDCLVELAKEFGLEFDYNRDVSSMARMGRKSEDRNRCRPLMVKFYSYTTKNMILESCYKLKKMQKFKSLIVSHDLSKEDREQCRMLIKKAKQEKEKSGEVEKFIYKVRGDPGSFYVVTVRRPNFL